MRGIRKQSTPGNDDLPVRERLPSILLVKQQDGKQKGSPADEQQDHDNKEEVDDLRDVRLLHATASAGPAYLLQCYWAPSEAQEEERVSTFRHFDMLCQYYEFI